MWEAGTSTDPLEFEEAATWFRRRVPLTDEQFFGLIASMRRRAFGVAGAATLDMVSAIQRSLERAIRSGQTFGDWKKSVPGELRRAWGKWRSEVIFRTNVQTAYSAARWKQLRAPAVLRARPFWMFDAVLDSRTTPVCSAAHGTVLPAEHEWWQTHTPPLHFACRSGIRSLRTAQALKRGVSETPPSADPQAGFGGAPSEEDWKPERMKYPPDMWEIYRRRNPTRWGDPPPANNRKPPWRMTPGEPKPIDESARQLEAKERRAAEVLAREGNDVVSRAVRPSGRSPDLTVNGKQVELKGFGKRGSADLINRLVRGVEDSFDNGGQADSIVFDARGSGITDEMALRAAARLRSEVAGELRFLRIIGDSFDLTFWDF